jgi:hypothetical protein
MVRADKNAAAIEQAMLDGDFYATTGVLLDDVTLSAKHLELRARGAGPFEFVFVGSGGRTLSHSSGTRAVYTPRGDEGYVRAVVSDAEGHKAWLQPVRPTSG